MEPAAFITIGIVLLVIGLLFFTRYGPDVILLGGLTLLLVAPTPTEQGWRLGVITAQQALSGLSNPGPVTVGVLYVVVAGIRETGGLHWIAQRVLGRPKSLYVAQLRVMGPVVVGSAFLNNTPVVAMMIPVISDWSRKLGFAASKLLMPLSYAAIFGGMCTLIGTSTNLVVNGLLLSETDHAPLGMFEIAWVGLPCAAAGMVYLLTAGRWLLPDRRSAMSQLQDPREYTVEMLVEPNSPAIGKSIEAAGLRHLPGMFLIEISRGEQILPAVSPDVRLQAGDRLVFAGVVESVVDLHRMPGLVPATNQVFKLDAPRTDRCLIQAVVSTSCPLVGQSVRAGRFRNQYDAVIIAIARDGHRINAKMGDVVLRAGDTLLLEASPAFVKQQENNRDFYLVSPIEDSTPLRHEKSVVALAILAAMVLFVAMGWLSMLVASMLAAGFMLLTRCCSGASARRSVDWTVLIVIAAALGIGRAMDVTGAAQTIATGLLRLAGENPLVTLAIMYFVTTLFTELLTNNAAAVLMFPIAIAAAARLDVDYMPFVIVIMMAASASFSTPVGYQTNLMVYGPGGYRFSDYARVGVALNVMIGVITVILAPRIWPF